LGFMMCSLCLIRGGPAAFHLNDIAWQESASRSETMTGHFPSDPGPGSSWEQIRGARRLGRDAGKIRTDLKRFLNKPNAVPDHAGDPGSLASQAS